MNPKLQFFLICLIRFKNIYKYKKLRLKVTDENGSFSLEESQENMLQNPKKITLISNEKISLINHNTRNNKRLNTAVSEKDSMRAARLCHLLIFYIVIESTRNCFKDSPTFILFSCAGLTVFLTQTIREQKLLIALNSFCLQQRNNKEFHF